MLTSIDFELKLRRVPSFDPIGDFGLQETGGVLQPTEAKRFLFLVAHDTDGHFCFAHVRTDLHANDGHVLNTWVAQVGQNGLSNDLTDRFGGFEKTAAGQGRRKGWGLRQ